MLLAKEQNLGAGGRGRCIDFDLVFSFDLVRHKSSEERSHVAVTLVQHTLTGVG